MPRCATSISPAFAAVAPVNAPFSCPNNSDSINSRARPAQFRSTYGSRARGPLWCIQRASTPLPAPVSPRISTGAWLFTTRTRLRLEIADRRARAEERRDGLPRLADLLAGDLPAVAAVLEALLDHDQQRRQIDRLGQELLGARLDGPHRQLDRAVAGQHDDRHVAIEALNAVTSWIALPSGRW